ncbi:MAG: RHS repeat-associated core domain-containing protein [Dehalococcoidales bacterium]|nr:RHS repeat-associated core domain-containing protein [Dehalococcoidales bacterium]
MRSYGTCGYYGARYYDPEIGRFISPDTIIPNPADPQSFNRYSYCLNNPLKYNDPSGHYTQEDVLLVPGLKDADPENTITVIKEATEDTQYYHPDMPVEDISYVQNNGNIPIVLPWYPVEIPTTLPTIPSWVSSVSRAVPTVLPFIIVGGICVGGIYSTQYFADLDAISQEGKMIAYSDDPCAALCVYIILTEDNTPPSKAPEKYRSWQDGTKINNETGEVWEKNKTSHGGKKWNVYKDKKAYENNRRNRTVWDDGNVEKRR